MTGRLERITYSNSETGYTVAKLRINARADAVTIVGKFAGLVPGVTLELSGTWKVHPSYGKQFDVREYRTMVPSTIYGIKKYLGSGLIKGIGPVMAERIVDLFGKDSLDVIENDPDRLYEVGGVGKKRIEMIRTAWADQKEIRDVMLFLQSHEVSAAYAVRIFKTYGNQAIDIVTENPYQLATDIFGIGFLTADKIAFKLGFKKDSALRIKAGLLYVLDRQADEGHVYYPETGLIEKCGEILEVSAELVKGAISSSTIDETIRAETIRVEPQVEPAEADAPADTDSGRAVYLSRYFVCETGIARMLAVLSLAHKSIRPVDVPAALKWVEGKLLFTLAEKQAAAVRSALKSKVMVITGGPGTGKTTIIRAILTIFKRLGVRVMLAAPTGRAAKRMSETTGHHAETIHRMLSYSFQGGGFQKNAKNPLAGDLLIVDEASMIDTVLMYHLLKAVPRAATMILVGDVNQLPSVGPGNVLKEIIASNAVPVVHLTEIFRQAANSRIIINAHRINKGVMPDLNPVDGDSDFYFINNDSPERVHDIIMELVAKRIPDRFGLDPFEDIQVLSPMHKGAVGTSMLNQSLQEALNPQKDEIVFGASRFRFGDKVMQIRNNYDKNVFNGDIGRVTALNRESREIKVDFDGRETAYDFNELDEVVPAYAISVHKSQGSEYPAVVIPLMTQHFMLLQRNLVYTAVTRGRRLVVLVGTRKALAIAVKNDKLGKRYTRLAMRLDGEMEKGYDSSGIY